MRVVGFEHELLDADRVARSTPKSSSKKQPYTRPVACSWTAGRRRPGRVPTSRVAHVQDAVEPFEQERHPADLALGERDLEVAGTRPSAPDNSQSVIEMLRVELNVERGGDRRRRVGGSSSASSSPSRCACRRPCPSRRTPRRTDPSGGPRRGSTGGRGGRQLGERDRAARHAPRCAGSLRPRASGSHSGTRQSGISRPSLVAAPLVDHPVVVGADARQRELLVVRIEEQLAREAQGVGKHSERSMRFRPCRRGAPWGRSNRGASRRSGNGRMEYSSSGYPTHAITSGVPRTRSSNIYQSAIGPSPPRTYASPPPGVRHQCRRRRLDTRSAIVVLRRQPRFPEMRRLDHAILARRDHPRHWVLCCSRHHGQRTPRANTQC